MDWLPFFDLTNSFSGMEAESWIIVTKHVRIINLCFKNLGIMNLCTSARESWITRLWEKLNKIHGWINCVRSRECRIWRLQESNFQPPYIISAFGADSTLVSPVTLCLMFSYIKNSMPRQNEWWYQVWMKQKFEHQRIQNETKLSLRKSLNQKVIKKSSWIMNLEENSCRNHESLRQKRQESWI